MEKFGCGVLVTILILGIIAGIWFSLDEQSKGIVVGLLLGGAGMLVGFAVALAVVCIFLLRTMHWQVQGGKSTQPIVMGWPGYGHTPLPPPEGTMEGQYQWHPPPPQTSWQRPGRGWNVLGGEDMPPGERPPPPPGRLW